MEKEVKNPIAGVAIHPGEYIKDELDFRNLSQKEFALRMQRPNTKINQLINGNLDINDDTAIRLEKVLGISAKNWLNLQMNYNLTKAYLSEKASRTAQYHYLKSIEYKQLVDLEILPPAKDKAEKILNLQKHLEVNTLDAVEIVYEHLFRSSPRTKFYPLIIAIWLKWGQSFADKIELQRFDCRKLANTIPKLKELSRKPEITQELVGVLNKAGVGVIITPLIKNCQVNGAVYKFGSNPIIQINDRRKWLDTFWFTVFHEIAHILLHFKRKKNPILIDYDGIVSSEEVEANNWACNALIPSDEYRKFVAEKKSFFTENAIVDIAAKLGVHPGIVVGRLQFDNYLKPQFHNHLRSKISVNKVWY